MRKSGDEIEADFFELVENSSLSTFIKGTVYREGMRPINAKTEDAVVSFKTGLDGQFQDGEVVLNVYVPNVPFEETLVKDVTRCRLIGAEIMEVVKTFTSGEYNVWLLNIPQSFAVDDIQQHYVNARIRFTRK